MTMRLRHVATAATAAALLVPAAAQAAPGNGNGNAYGHAKNAVPAPHAALLPAGETDGAVAGALAEETILAPEAIRPAPRGRALGRAKAKHFLFRGSVVAVDGVAGTVDVEVRGGNSRGRRFRGEVVTFDLGTAAIAGTETDGLAGITAADLLAGDRVVVHARLPRTASADGTTIAARRLVDLTEREPAPLVDGQTAGETDPVDEAVPVDPVVE